MKKIIVLILMLNSTASAFDAGVQIPYLMTLIEENLKRYKQLQSDDRRDERKRGL